MHMVLWLKQTLVDVESSSCVSESRSAPATTAPLPLQSRILQSEIRAVPPSMPIPEPDALLMSQLAASSVPS